MNEVPGSAAPQWTSSGDGLVGTVVGDRYQIQRIIGDGGMGVVYLAEHTTLRKPVALKVLRQELCQDRAHVDRFLREARAASMIGHQNIVDISDFGHTPAGSVFFAMEYLQGEDLAAILTREHRIPWPRARHIMLQVVRALGAAHAKSVVHRDLKPGNCFVLRGPDGLDFVKLLDFGIAKIIDDSNPNQDGLTRAGAVFGTAKYMAPEQASGGKVDNRTDVYSAGVLLYELLTGRAPYDGENFMRILSQHLNEPIPSPRQVAPDALIPEPVEVLLLKALAKRADDRFQSMADFQEALLAADNDQTVAVHMPMRSGGTAPPHEAATGGVISRGDITSPPRGSDAFAEPEHTVIYRPPEGALVAPSPQPGAALEAREGTVVYNPADAVAKLAKPRSTLVSGGAAGSIGTPPQASLFPQSNPSPGFSGPGPSPGMTAVAPALRRGGQGAAPRSATPVATPAPAAPQPPPSLTGPNPAPGYSPAQAANQYRDPSPPTPVFHPPPRPNHPPAPGYRPLTNAPHGPPTNAPPPSLNLSVPPPMSAEPSMLYPPAPAPQRDGAPLPSPAEAAAWGKMPIAPTGVPSASPFAGINPPSQSPYPSAPPSSSPYPSAPPSSSPFASGPPPSGPNPPVAEGGLDTLPTVGNGWDTTGDRGMYASPDFPSTGEEDVPRFEPVPDEGSRNWVVAMVAAIVVFVFVSGFGLWVIFKPDAQPEDPLPQVIEDTPVVAQPEPQIEPQPIPTPTPPPPVFTPPPADPAPTPRPTPRKPREPTGKEQLNKFDIDRGINRAASAVKACGEKNQAIKGTLVSITYSISVKGRASDVAVQRPHTNTPLGQCVAKAVRRHAKFPRSKARVESKHRFRL